MINHRFDDNERGIRECAFSIQNIALEALEYGRLPGDWYSVSNISYILERLNDKYRPVPNFKIYVF